MTILASAIAPVLFAIAALHAYWGLGGVWPGSNAADCARRVIGFAGMRRMPGPGPSFAVAAALLAVAVLVLLQGNLIVSPLPAGFVSFATLCAALVFLGRGVAGFTPAWRRLTPEQPFATLDIRYYSPLCLALGAGIALLAVQGMTI
ncbi:MAG: DUF3995 domain-containing protein [Mesorhizobium sp.]|nr:DUF3995 domain-containing protein [Mesorhizobium sp.]